MPGKKAKKPTPGKSMFSAMAQPFLRTAKKK